MANHSHHGHAHSHGHGHGHGDEADLAELLDLDAEVLGGLLEEAAARLAETAGEPGRILDLGSGTGAGALALLRHFGAAEVVAVDASEFLLHRLQDRARALGVADRVRTVRADLDEGLPPVGAVDLAWASLSLHHLKDPDRVLGEVFAALRPGGVLAVVEMDSFPRFLPDDLGFGEPGLEARCHALLAEQHRRELPDLGSDWGPRLTRAGFTAAAEHTLTAALEPPIPDAATRYARSWLHRLRLGIEDLLSPADRSTLDALLDDHGPHSLRTRTDLAVHATRTLWTARRP